MIAELKTVSLRVDRQAIGRYADITGDHNPIHVDPEFAAKTAMGGVIAHGTLSMNLLWQSLAATFGNAALRGAALEIRFVLPVREGDTVAAGGRATGKAGGSFDVWVRNQKGESVIEGSITVRPAAMAYPGPVVSARWLADRLGDPAVRIVDATVHLPDTGRNARAEYLQCHIPGASFFDFDLVADASNPLPRKCPGAGVFADQVGALGIGNDTHVVAYDAPGLYSAARVWWLFRHYGYHRVSILDGGLKAWRAAGLPVEAGAVTVPPQEFHPGEEQGLLARWPRVLEAARAGEPQIVDARTPGRFAGTEQDRYPGTRAGRIPRSRNLYWASMLDPETRCLLPEARLRERFTAAGMDYGRPAILTCGSGLTACILALALHLTGKNDWQVYDGSWDEWGRRADLPIDGVPDQSGENP